MNEACKEIDRILNSRNSLADWTERGCWAVIAAAVAYLSWHLGAWAARGFEVVR